MSYPFSLQDRQSIGPRDKLGLKQRTGAQKPIKNIIDDDPLAHWNPSLIRMGRRWKKGLLRETNPTVNSPKTLDVVKKRTKRSITSIEVEEEAHLGLAK